MSRISEIRVWDYRPAFRDGPYAMAHAVQTHVRARLYRLVLGDGTIGLGEAVFPPYLPVEDVDEAVAAEPAILAALAGATLDDAQAAVDTLAARDTAWRALGFGLETAVLDARARRAGRPLCDLLGGAGTGAVETYRAVTERTAEGVRARIRAFGDDAPVVQLKLAVGTPDDDAAQIDAALGALGPDRVLLADANGGWSPETAQALIRTFDPPRAGGPRLYWEEPCRTYDENRTLADRLGVRVMVDQCVGDPAAAERAIADGVAAAVCIKPPPQGGLSVARRLRDLSAEAGVAMRLDGPYAGDVATAAILHLALGAPEDLLISGCDLREPLVLDPDLGGAESAGPGRVRPPAGPGLGIADPVALLGPAAVRHA